MIQLHYYPSTAAMVPHILLEEIGVPFQRVLVDRMANAHKTPEYLRLNPNGLIPVLVDGDLVLYETAAITLHLCDSHPGARLAPAVGSNERAHFYKWLAWLSTTVQPALSCYFYPERWVDEGNAEGAKQLKRHAQAKVGAMLDQLDAHVANTGGPWFMGRDYSALDPYVFTLCRWTRNFDAGRARERANLGPYLQRMLERPAVQRVFASEELKPPFV